jgi:hypothetical protein
MKRSQSNPPTLSKRRSIRGWLKRVTIPNSNQRKVAPDNGQKGKKKKRKKKQGDQSISILTLSFLLSQII